MTNALMQQVDSLKSLAQQQLDIAFSNAQKVMSFSEISNVRKIYIAGLGDISRIKETIRQSFAVGRPTYLIINEDAKMTDIPESCIIRLPFVEDEMLQPLGSYIPTTIFANHLADLLDESLFRGNIYPQGFNTIRNSQVVVYGINGNKIKEI